MAGEITIDFVEDGALWLSPNTSHQYAFPEELHCETDIGVRSQHKGQGNLQLIRIY